MLAFTILVPLAITSNAPMIRRLGGAAWQRLHRLVYLAAAAAVLHFIMLVKSWSPELILYAVLIAGLLAFRLLARRPRRGAARRPAVTDWQARLRSAHADAANPDRTRGLGLRRAMIGNVKQGIGVRAPRAKAVRSPSRARGLEPGR